MSCCLICDATRGSRYVDTPVGRDIVHGTFNRFHYNARGVLYLPAYIVVVGGPPVWVYPSF